MPCGAGSWPAASAMKNGTMRQDEAIRIYQAAVDATMGAEQGSEWWADVAVELASVIAAPDTTTAASIIGRWHEDWRMVGQTPRRVAGRIRRQAARLLNA